MKPHRGVLILVLGILGFVLCGPFTAIPAWVMGNSDLKAMAAGEMDRAGEALTQAGKICGIIVCALSALSLIVGIVLLVIGGTAAAFQAR